MADQPQPNWSLRNLSGSLSGVNGAIDASVIPDHWKTVIKAEIASVCGEDKNFVYVDASMQYLNGNAILHFHAKAETKLL